MINQRKKKKKDIRDIVGIERKYSSKSRGPQNLTQGMQGTAAAGHIAGKLSSNETEIDRLMNAQLDTVQENMDTRADAEESNLDILDRGSRYTRKNKKLKEFKDAQSAEV